MCQLDTEGTHHGCGHYIITKKVGKHDCNNKYCTHSSSHAKNCPHCPNCNRYVGPDLTETTTLDTSTWCDHCEYWYNGAGAKRKS